MPIPSSEETQLKLFERNPTLLILHMFNMRPWALSYRPEKSAWHIRVILQELPNSCPQTLMSHYRIRFWNIKKIICVLCWSICMCIFTLLKLVISLKARTRFWFYSGKGLLFLVSLEQVCIFLIKYCIISLWTRVWHNMMHRCLIHKRAQYDNYI